MRLLIIGLLGSSLIPGAHAQGVTVVFPPPAPVTVTHVIVAAPVIVAPRQSTYMIAFRDSAVRFADAYWVSGNMLHFITPDHQMQTAPVASVDRSVSERLNRERNVAFFLPLPPAAAGLRSLLQQRLNVILGCHYTSRGLMINISDVLFDFDQATLTASARDKLAGIAGVLMDYAGVTLHLDGHTDNIGSAAHNLDLSRRRAAAVRDYLLSQGVPAANVTAAGFGKAKPIASNETAAGRQQNRRVEMLISGEAIGISVSSTQPD
jgi:outer membrane protein OmpA-like peptidoglycan-associated protein